MLHYRIFNTCWLLLTLLITVPSFAQNAGSQQQEISGTITEESGEPIIGATVSVKNQPQKAASDINGKFKIKAAPNSELTVSYIGFITETVKTGSQKAISIILKKDSKMLDNVVVTALGIKRQEKALGYAVQKVQGENLQTVKGVDVATSLTGKVAGLNVLNTTEFGDAPTIQLRGETPLLVIDGVPYVNMTLRDIAPDDIESISVLKGASASALYGSRGQSGAIMITTKKGAGKEGVSVAFNSSTMFTAGYLAIPELQSTYGRAIKQRPDGQYEYVRSGDGSWGAPLEGQSVIQWDPVSKSMKPMPYLPIGKDNFANFLQQGYILNNNLSITQQGKLGSLRASGNWVDNKGQYPNSKFDKYTFTLGGNIKMDKFTFTGNMGYNKNTTPNKGFSGYTGYDPMYSLLIWSAPDWDIRQYKDYWLTPNEVQNNSYTAGNNNPYFDRYERLYSVDKDIFNGSFELKYDIARGVNVLGRVGYDTYSDREQVRVSKGSFQGAGSTYIIPNGTQVWGESDKGSFNIGQSRGYSINSDFIVSAEKKIKDFNVDGFVGGSVLYNQDEGIEAFTRGGLSVPGFYSLKASVNPVITNSRIYKRQTNSMYGRLGISWKSLIFAEGTLRNDWVSTLSKTSRSYLYPSLSGSFIASELLPKTDWLSLWKIRGSWVTAKKPAGIYDINSVYSINNNVWGTFSSAVLPTTIRGTDVFPESTSTYEIGTAFSLFMNRVSFDAAYFNKRAYDFIKQASISPASGYSQNFINTQEEIARKGVELTLNVVPVKTKDLSWNVNINWSKYADYYAKLDPIYSADRPWVKVGERADAFVYRDFLRDREGNIVHNSSGLPQYSNYDSKYGNAGPNWIWGFGSGVKYKNWQLNISMDGRVGGYAQSITEMYMWRSGGHPNSVTPERYLDATVPNSKNYIGQGVKVVSGTATYDTYGNIVNDTRVFAKNDVPTTYKSYIENLHKGTAWGGSPSPVDIYSTTFFKIRELSLTYNLPQNIASKIKANNVSLSLIGQNVLLWAKDFKYSDPDGGSENFADPSQRFLGFNLKVGF